MADIEATTGWHPTATSATGTAHYWHKVRYSQRRSACGLLAVAKQLQDESESLSRCAKCESAVASAAQAAAQEQPAQRGRPVTGKAKTSAERNKAADDALVDSGGRVYRARLAPESNAALSALADRLGVSDKDALDAALIFAEKNMK